MEAVELASGEERAMRTSAFRVRFAQRRGFYSPRVKHRSVLFFPSVQSGIGKRLASSKSGWSPTRKQSCRPALRT